MIISSIGLFISGLALGIGISNITWNKYCDKMNKDWYQFTTHLIDEYYKRRNKNAE